MYQDMNPPHSLHQLFKRILTTTGSQAAASPGKRKVPADLSAGPFRRRQRSSERLSVHPPAEASSRCSTVGGACQEELSTSSELGTLTTLLWRSPFFTSTRRTPIHAPSLLPATATVQASEALPGTQGTDPRTRHPSWLDNSGSDAERPSAEIVTQLLRVASSMNANG